jgi:hypothetical protein
MRRLFWIAATAAVLALTLAPAAMAADPVLISGGGAVVSVNGTLVVPEGQTLDAAVVVDGTGTIAGSVDTIVVVHGTVTLNGATASNLVVMDGTAILGPGSTVTDDVATLRGTVTRDPSAVVGGRFTQLDADLAGFAVLMIPLLLLFTVGFALAMIAAGLVLAAFGARQTRTAGALIRRQPLKVLVAGIVGTIVLPMVAGLLILTIIGAPIGLAVLLLVLPAVSLLGWLVAAILLGDWLIGSLRGAPEAGHPYAAAALGVVVLALAGIVPFVGTIATILGFGAILLGAWHTLRPTSAEPVAPNVASVSWSQPQSASTASAG